MALTWDESLATGIPKVDTQHKELIRQVESLLEFQNRERFHQTIEFLEDYVVRHFHDEEELMIESSYPKLAEHKALHDAFVTTIGELKDKFEAEGETEENKLELYRAATKWLMNHILSQDRKFAEFYRSRGK